MSNFKIKSVLVIALGIVPSLSFATCYQTGNTMICNGQPYYLTPPQVNVYQQPRLQQPQTTFTMPQGADISGSYMRGMQAGQEMRLRQQQIQLQQQQIEMQRRVLEQQGTR